VTGPASLLGEDIPVGLLLSPPARPLPLDLLPDRLPQAWQGGQTSVLALAAGLSYRVGRPLPWRMVKDALDSAFNVHYLERTGESAAWPCDYGGAQWVKIQVPETKPVKPGPVPKPGARIAQAALQPNQIQDLADSMGDLLAAAASIARDLWGSALQRLSQLVMLSNLGKLWTQHGLQVGLQPCMK